ncbi:hypothetical protein TNCV_5066261 [Trichonephila clavipes]|nr:hypothetical protein TNCV_5066261 [Trichonephila clavipes]
MTSKLYPKTVRTQATIKRMKSLILKEHPSTQRLIASKLGMSPVLKKELETEIKCIAIDEIRVKSPYASAMDFSAFGLLKRDLRKRHPRTHTLRTDIGKRFKRNGVKLA